MVTIETKKGDVFNGTYKEIGRDSIVIVDASGELKKIAKSEILYIDQSNGKSNWFTVPVNHRYFFGATAIPLRKYEVVFENNDLVINSVKFGLTNRLTLGAGMVLRENYFFMAKYSVYRKRNYSLSMGVSYYNMPKDLIETPSGEDLKRFGKISAMSTWGNLNFNVSVNVSYLYARSGFVPPFVTISGFGRVTKHLGILTENTFSADVKNQLLPVCSMGTRWFGKRGAFDAGVYLNALTSKELFILPYLAYSFKIVALRESWKRHI
jgi:hypothetical protein